MLQQIHKKVYKTEIQKATQAFLHRTQGPFEMTTSVKTWLQASLKPNPKPKPSFGKGP